MRAITNLGSLLSRCCIAPVHKTRAVHACVLYAHFTSAAVKIREIDTEIQTTRLTMSASPARIASLMRHERINATQVEDLMDIAQRLDYVTKPVHDAYSQFYASRRHSFFGGSEIERLDSLQEHNLQTIELMTKLGKDKRMYTILMAAYGMCGNAHRANALLRTMKEERIAPTREIYNLLISINGKDGDLERCSKLFKEMSHFGHEPNVKSWNVLLELNGRLGYIYECARIYDEMAQKGITHYKSTYDVLLRVYAQQGLSQTCDFLVTDMENLGISRDTSVYNVLIETHGAKGELEHCARLLDTMRVEDLAPDAGTYTAYIDACAKHAHYKQGYAAYIRMCSDGVRPNTLTYRCVLACAAALRDWDACVALVADLDAQGVEIDEKMYDMMLKVVQEMDEEGRGVRGSEGIDRQKVMRTMTSRGMAVRREQSREEEMGEEEQLEETFKHMIHEIMYLRENN